MNNVAGHSPQFSGRGHSTYSKQVGLDKKLLAMLTDFLVAAVLTEAVYGFSHLSPVFNLKFLAIFGCFWLLPLFIGRLRLLLSSAQVISASAGEWIWGIRRLGESRSAQLAENHHGIILTPALILLSIILFQLKIANTPEWITASEMTIDAVVPPSDWRVLAFHYSLAAWPVAQSYFMPYEFGPPKRFVGKVEAKWNETSSSPGSTQGYSDEKLVFEGPKTPLAFQSGEVSRKTLRECVVGSPSLWDGGKCATIREISLERPLEEMRKLGFSDFKLKWFSAANPVLPEEERAQGIFLRGSAGHDKNRFQDRYILVSPKGMHQSLIFSYLDVNSPEKVKLALGTLRFSDDLGPGRAWVDRELETTRLGQLPSTSDPAYLLKLIEAEGLLVSKISVEPAPIDTYFHLAGIQAMLLQYGKAHHRGDIVDDAKQMLDQVHRFSDDIAAQFPSTAPEAHRAHEIEKLWHESLQF
jgi:hypothetical protein